MGLFKINRADDAIFSTSFKLVDGISAWGQNIFVIKAELRPDRITFYQSPIGQTKTISLYYDQIVETAFYTEAEILEKSKSVIGRSIAGAALFGPVGAIIGAISGSGTKKVSKSSLYYTITYTDIVGELEMLTLGTECTPCNYWKFDRLLKEHLLNNEQEVTPEFL